MGVPPSLPPVYITGQNASMFNVFISYSTDDLKNVDQLKVLLENSGVEVFVAEHSVLPGQNLPEEIKKAIRDCDVFILLWSQSARGSDWVPQEIGIAQELGKQIVPLVLEEGLGLTGFIRELKYIPVYKDPEAALELALEMVFAGNSKKTEVEKQKQVSAEKQKQTEAIFFGAVGLILLWAFTQS